MTISITKERLAELCRQSFEEGWYYAQHRAMGIYIEDDEAVESDWQDSAALNEELTDETLTGT